VETGFPSTGQGRYASLAQPGRAPYAAVRRLSDQVHPPARGADGPRDTGVTSGASLGTETDAAGA
jgi:hypothetical protein